jgi:hypothetical protein
MGRACSKNGEKRNTYMLLVGKPETKEKQVTGEWIMLRRI